ncbi:MAG: hypothetical protein SGILL_002109 [Bacillariaceae sp.]
MAFREDDSREKMEFSSDLTNTERKYVHLLASQLGMVSKSSGKGESRKITVSKHSATKKKTAVDDDVPVLSIGRIGMEALRKHIQQFPPTHTEEMESRETGASLVEAMKTQGNIASTLQELSAGAPRQAEIAQVKTKHVDLKRRRERHAHFQSLKAGQEFQRILQNRNKLPAYSRRQEIVDVIQNTPVTIIQGETGCGKSTQCPQFLLDAYPDANIAVTQPRRISAISIAERVAQEQCLLSPSQRNDNAPGVGSLVGYQVRLEVASSRDTQLLFLTPGVLLRKMQSSPMLLEYTHIVIDEVHERDKYTEFLLIRLRDLLPLRPDLRLILMSATIQADVLMNYFVNAPDLYFQAHPPKMISIEGRTFPVQEFFLEHVLELTNFIDIESMGEVGVSMDQLDTAMARLLTNGESATTTPDAAVNIVSCAMCGKEFSNPVQLGEHIAVCTGMDEGGDIIAGTESAAEAKTAAFSTAGMLQFLEQVESDDEPDFEEFEDYDVDAAQETVEYQFQDVAGLPSLEEAYETSGDGKWDGTGEFQANVEQAVDLSPKQEKYLEHYQTMHDDEQVDEALLLEILHYIIKSSHGEGAILVFLPGWQEISEMMCLLESTTPFNNRSKYLVLPLHSGIPSAEQRRVLRRPPPGVRKIVLSTNIAETSLTIDDVAFVVDSGKAKEKDYDPHLKTSTLLNQWVSKSSSKQRKGRAGRTKAGVCFHLFSSRRHQSLRPFVESELLRTPLEEMCLMTKKLGLAPGSSEEDDGVPAFLRKAITPPHEKSIANALELLVSLGAMLPETNDLTTLGECLSVLSLEPRVGLMVIWSYLLGCSRVASNMAVSMSYKTPFVLPPPSMRRDAEKAQLLLSNHSESDQITVLHALKKGDQLKKRSGQGAYRDWCRRNYLSPSTLDMVGSLRKNLSRELGYLGYNDPNGHGYQNRHDKQHVLWLTNLAAGLYPNIATRKRGEVNFSTATNRKCKLHVSSVNAIKGQPLNAKCAIPAGDIEFVCYGEIVKGKHFFTLSQTTHLPTPLPLLLLTGNSLSIHPAGKEEDYSILSLDQWITFKCEVEAASALTILRKRLNSAFWNSLSDPKHGLQGLIAVEHDALECLGVLLKSAFDTSAVR